ncbi:MAG: type IV secretory system conjugative DNA transfer family protein, partial [Luteimonas sp.]
EQRDAEEYSKMLGDTTVRRRQRSTSHGQGGSVSYTEIEERRELMKPQELKALGGDHEIIFYEGCPHPIKCNKIKYYSDKFFKDRLLEKVKIPPLSTGDTSMPSKTAQAVTAAGTLALAACASQPTVAATSAREVRATTTATSSATATVDTESAASIAKVEQLGQRLLTLIGGLQTIDDLTLTRVEETLGVKMKEDARIKGAYDFQGDLTKDWHYYLSYEAPEESRPELTIFIAQNDKYKPQSMTEVCLEFEQYSELLAAQGFKREPRYYQLHGSGISYWEFFHPIDNYDNAIEIISLPPRDKNKIEIHIEPPEREFNTVDENKNGRLCIASIWIGNGGSKL